MSAETARNPVVAWLLEPQEPAVRYLASRDLLVPRPGSAVLAARRSAIAAGGWAASILARQEEATWWGRKDTCYWPRQVGTYWSLAVLADLGLTREDFRVANGVEHMLRIHLAPDGGFSPFGPPKPSHFCSTGIMARTLLQLGYTDDPRTWRAIDWLVEAQLPEGGWDCHLPGRSTLDAWEAMAAFAAIPARMRSREVRASIARGAEFYLRHGALHQGPRYPRWTELHYPWHYWYDVLVGVDFLTALGYGKDPRLQEALSILRSKRRRDGRWALDSTNGKLILERPGRPSKMVTFLALRVLRRVAASVTPSASGPRAGSSRRPSGTGSRAGSTR